MTLQESQSERLIRRLRRLQTFSSSDLRLIIESAIALAAIRVAFFFFSFHTLLGLLDAISESTATRTRLASGRPERVAWAVDLVSRQVRSTENCLIRALAVRALLKRRLHPTELRFGVAPSSEGGFAAHAWVESDGAVVIGGRGLAVFTPLCGKR